MWVRRMLFLLLMGLANLTCVITAKYEDNPAMVEAAEYVGVDPADLEDNARAAVDHLEDILKAMEEGGIKVAPAPEKQENPQEIQGVMLVLLLQYAADKARAEAAAYDLTIQSVEASSQLTQYAQDAGVDPNNLYSNAERAEAHMDAIVEALKGGHIKVTPAKKPEKQDIDEATLKTILQYAAWKVSGDKYAEEHRPVNDTAAQVPDNKAVTDEDVQAVLKLALLHALTKNGKESASGNAGINGTVLQQAAANNGANLTTLQTSAKQALLEAVADGIDISALIRAEKDSGVDIPALHGDAAFLARAMEDADADDIPVDGAAFQASVQKAALDAGIDVSALSSALHNVQKKNIETVDYGDIVAVKNTKDNDGVQTKDDGDVKNDTTDILGDVVVNVVAHGAQRAVVDAGLDLDGIIGEINAAGIEAAKRLV